MAYPRGWRDRYGDELAVVLEAEYECGRLSVRAAFDVIAAGLVERLRSSGLVGDGRPPAERVRAGLLLVLCAWSAFVVAGVVLQKTAEHWQAATPPPQRPLPSGALDAVSAAAALGSAGILLGVLLAAQPLRALVRSGGWSQLRRPILRASGLAALTGLVLGIVVVWAHHLTEAGRNGGDGLYAAAALVLFAVAVVALAAWTHAGVVAARRLALGAETLRRETYLAAMVTVSMAAMTIGTATWWASVASAAPAFLGGGLPWGLLAATLTMTVATILAGAGTLRSLQSARLLGRT